jgi:hypothetical protein
MPNADQIQEALAGAWQMMFGKPDGLRRLDLSIDGFWDSFFSIVLALPPLLVGWVASANDHLLTPGVTASRTSAIFAFGIVEIAAWILPLIGLAFVVRPAGIADRFVAYVVSTNWASLIIAWLMLPISLLQLLFPDALDLISSLSLLFFLAMLVLVWRLTNVAIGRGAAVATAVFTAMIIASIATVYFVGWLVGVAPASA